MSSPLPEDVRSAMAAGQKIEAIRLLRKHTGLGLADAKAAVEAGNLPDSNRSQPVIREIPAQAQAALVAGETLQAIRLVREAYGIGLKEAKDIVDAHGQYHGGQGRGPRGPAPGEVARSKVGGLVLVVVLLVLGAIAWLTLRA